MAINDTSAKRAIGIWLDTFTPPLSTEIRQQLIDGQMGNLVKAIFQCIREDAVITPGSFVSDGDPVTGAGVVT